jgi:predicted nucleic acid-binding protein
VITAVDSSVLLDVFTADEEFGVVSREALRACAQQGGLLACEVVWAEVTGAFPRSQQASSALARLGIDFDPLSSVSAVAAGEAWRTYRAQGGRRARVIADFVIGAHALRQADRLLTRDRGFYRTYFSRLSVVDPSA